VTGQSERDRAFGQAWADGMRHGIENANPMPPRLREAIADAHLTVGPPPDPKFVRSHPAGGEAPPRLKYIYDMPEDHYPVTFPVYRTVRGSLPVNKVPRITQPPPYDPDLSLIAEQRWEAPLYVEPANTDDFDPFGPPPAPYTERHTRIKVEGGQLDLGLVKVEPWRWWMRFVPGRPRAVNYLRSFPPGPTQDEDARAWWESLR
jgi:hypothetical protein